MRAWAIAPAAVALAAIGSPVWADMPAPQEYLISEPAPGMVVVRVLNYAGRTCPDQGLLRRNVASGEIVEITTCQDAQDFLDQCVPAGDYQYGLAVPFACEGSGGTYYYGAVTVSQGASLDCTRTIDAPVAALSVPWSEAVTVCAPSYSNDRSHGCGTGGTVLGTNLLVLLAGAAIWRWRPRRSCK